MWASAATVDSGSPGDGGARRGDRGGSRRSTADPAGRRTRAGGRGPRSDPPTSSCWRVMPSAPGRSRWPTSFTAAWPHEPRCSPSSRTRWWIASSSGEGYPARTPPRDPSGSSGRWAWTPWRSSRHPSPAPRIKARVLPPWCDQHGFRSVVVVTETDHSRRLRRVLRRSLKGHRTTFAVRASRYSQFDPDRWWETRAGARTGIVELREAPARRRASPASLTRRRRQAGARRWVSYGSRRDAGWRR